jgi:hypothetical protein
VYDRNNKIQQEENADHKVGVCEQLQCTGAQGDKRTQHQLHDGVDAQHQHEYLVRSGELLFAACDHVAWLYQLSLERSNERRIAKKPYCRAAPKLFP